MGSSLQEQLLKAGLITEQQLRREKARGAQPVRREKKNRKAPRAALPRSHQSTPTTDGKPRGANSTRADDAVGQQPEKQNKTASAGERKLLRAKIKILLRRHRVNDPEAETPYHFLVGKHIRRIYVSAIQHALLRQGQLAIVPFGERHYLVPMDKLAPLQQLEPDLTVIIHQPAKSADSEADDRDAGYPVPDDLIW